METEKEKFCIPTFLAVATTAGVFIFIAGLFFKSIPETAKTLIDVQFGVIVAKWASIIDYHFGSSSGSAAKSKAIETMVADNNSNEEKQK